ncbi:MAG: Gx transporter family protein [Clostridiales bacterium]|nr:Gx transporter family protein [Clostridiales bacterium]
MNKLSLTKKTALYAACTTLAVIFSYVEAILPINTGVPGLKLGLANVAVVVMLKYAGIAPAAVVNLARILIMGLLFPSSFIYSLCGGILSFAVMAILEKCGFGEIGISAAGGVFHNIGQVAVAVVILENARLWLLLCVLCAAGLIAGMLTGALSALIVKKLPKTKISKKENSKNDT